MDIKHIRDLFFNGTRIIVYSYQNRDNQIEMNDYLYGSGMGTTSVFGIRAISENKVLLCIDMPEAILDAWKNYANSIAIEDE